MAASGEAPVSNRDLGVLILIFAETAAFGIPVLGIPLRGMAMTLRALVSLDDHKPVSMSKDEMSLAIQSAVQDTFAREKANNIAGSFAEYSRRIDSLLWRDDGNVPDISDRELDDLSDYLSAEADGRTQLVSSIANLEDPVFGKHFVPGLIMGQALRLQLEKILMAIDYKEDGKVPHSRVRTAISLCDQYYTSLNKVRMFAEMEALHAAQLTGMPDQNAVARDQALKRVYQGNAELGERTLQSYQKQRHDWQVLLQKIS